MGRNPILSFLSIRYRYVKKTIPGIQVVGTKTNYTDT